MNHLSKFIVLTISSFILFYGCTSTKAVYTERNPPNEDAKSKNNIVEYKEPRYETEYTGMYYGTILAFPIAGAAYGFLNPFVQKDEFNDATLKYEKTDQKWESALYGALGGVVISYLFGKFIAPNTGTEYLKSGQDQKWIEDINDKIRMNSMIVQKYKNSSDTISNFFLIPKSSETNFKMENLDDAFLFTSAFPRSKYSVDVLKSQYKNYKRNEIPDLINYFKGDNTSSILNPVIQSIKLHYLNTGVGLYKYVEAYKRYPTLEKEAEMKTAKDVSNISEYKYYLENFPKGASAPEVRKKLEKAEKEYEEELKIAREKAEEEARIKKEKTEKARVEWEKEKQRKFDFYSPAEREKLALEISSLKNKIEILKSEKNVLIEEKENIMKKRFKISSKFTKMRQDLYIEASRKGVKADYKQKEIYKLNVELQDLYEKAPWLR